MPSQIIARGFGTFGGIACVATRGFSCAVSSRTSCVQAVTSGETRNNRVTVYTGMGMQHQDRGENKTASAEHFANELGERFNDPRYYGRVL
tara:strand:+ start:2955 stop:3227 length:273 start_codon:yes stop_codon:yes gene_type:complete